MSTTLTQRLSSRKKFYLTDLNRYIGAGIRSSSKKDELVSGLADFILNSPAKWLARLTEYELKLLVRAVRNGRGKVFCFPMPMALLYIEVFGIVETDFDGSEVSLRLDDDIYDAIAPVAEDVYRYKDITGGYDSERFVWGVLAVHGVMKSDELVELYGEHFGKYSFYSNCSDNFALMSALSDEYAEHFAVDDRESILDSWKEKKISIKKYPKEYYISAGKTSPYWLPGADDRRVVRFLDLLKECGLEDFYARSLASLLWYESQRLPLVDVLGSVFDILSDGETDDSFAEEYKDTAIDFINSLPMWDLNGMSLSDTASEAPARNDLLVKSLESALDKIRSNSLNVKVGRNDMCPCGSGKKFKDCHGKFHS